MKFYQPLERAMDRVPAGLVNGVVLLLGVLSTGAGVYVATHPDWKTVWLSVGCSLIASSIVSWLTARYLTRAERVREVIRDWGLVAIFRTRQEMNRAADRACLDLAHRLDILAWGLKSFRESKDHEVRAQLARGLHLRILAPHPDSPMIAQREQEEREVPGQIRNTLLQLEDWVNTLKEVAPTPAAVQLRWYRGLPQDFYFRADDQLFIGPYLYGLSSQQTISYQFAAPSHGFDYYTRYFDRLWDDPEFAEDPDAL